MNRNLPRNLPWNPTPGVRNLSDRLFGLWQYCPMTCSNIAARRTLLGMSLILVAGCGGSESKPAVVDRDPATVPIGDTVTESDYESLVAEFGCYAIAPCCAGIGYRYDAATCRSVYAALAKVNDTQAIQFDPAAAAACLKAFQSNIPACGAKGPSECSSVYAGTLQPGTACSNDGECRQPAGAKAECDVTDSVCVTLTQGKLGDACDQTCMSAAEAAGVAFCSMAMVTQYPNAPYAHVACDRAAGLTCSVTSAHCEALSIVGAACTSDSTCVVGAYCETAGTTSGTCKSRPAVGQPCGSTAQQCAMGAYCDSQLVCRARKAQGESCASSTECLGTCNASGTCDDTSITGAFSNAFTALLCGGQSLTQ